MAVQRVKASEEAAYRPSFDHHHAPRARLLAAALAALCVLSGVACSSGGGTVQSAGGQGADPETVDFPIFYVKRYSIPATQDDLRLLRFAQPSADLFMRTRAAPDGTEINITQRITGTGTAQAADYDIKDVSVSADGSTILFAMRGPLAKNMQQDRAPSWRIWQYVIATDTLSAVVNPATDPDPATVNDVAPQFLPDGRIVFSSTRQRQSQAVLLDEGFPQFVAEDEARTEPAFVLHVMDSDGTDIHQISFNPSDDRDPTVLLDGRVMWSRWDDAPGNSHTGMSLYTANPDGTDVELLYGANSHRTGPNGSANADATVEFVKAHEMQDGRILALIRPYQGVQTPAAPLGEDFGGDLVIIDTQDYVESTQAVLAAAGLTGPAQTPATPNDVLTVPGPSPGGRFYAGYPLWDGTGRILASWSQCRLLDPTVMPNTLQACTTDNLANTNLIVAPPIYSLWMFDPRTNTLQPIMQPTDGIMITDIVAAQPRTAPQVILDEQPGIGLDQNFYDAGVGVIDIRSVYDFDGTDSAPGGIATLADPGKTTAAQRPARFVRIEKAVSIPDPKFRKLDGAAFGVSSYMRQILGYAPVEPDGSVRIQVPANVPFQIDVLDANARRIFPPHEAWLQVRPGEEVKCNGCHTPASTQRPAAGETAHSHGRSGLTNSAYAGAATTGLPFPDTLGTFSPNAGDTMAETRTRWSCSNDTPQCLAMMLSPEVSYDDVWTDQATAARKPDASFSYDYHQLLPSESIPAAPGCVASPTSWAPTCRIIINYIEHIQPLWDAPRAAAAVPNGNTCTSCHSTTSAAGASQVPAASLDLSSTASNQQPLQTVSYVELLSGRAPLDPTTGLPEQCPGPPDANGNPTTVACPQLAPPMIAGDAHDSTAFFGIFDPTTGDPAHRGLLNTAELRLISEWLDIGAQYFNNPFDPKAPVN
ncbi:MAG: hypothetical protein ACREUT_15365 [Steroidobacteraceae bacterium]